MLLDDLDTADQPCYDMKGLTRNYEFISQLSRYVNELGWGNYANDHEDANGQFESNFDYADALTTSDRAIFFRYMVHAMAQERGHLATFMPKPFAHLTGNGAHLHVSLWDPAGEVNLFEDDDDPRGLGLSKLGYQFLAGVIEHMEAGIALMAPTVNSYKRIGVGAPTSGATWSPAYATYGMNNRTQAIRIPAPGRIEIRSVDGSANPYLAATALLATGLDGMARGLDPGEPNPRTSTTCRPDEVHERGIKSLPVDAARGRRAPADATTCCATGSAGASARTTSTTSSRRSATSTWRTTAASPTGSSSKLPDAVLSYGSGCTAGGHSASGSCRRRGTSIASVT